jgi:aldehyde:ferredoxin oxidoreductase
MADLIGMTGKIARVDLTTGTVTVIEPEEELYKKFLGGSALGLLPPSKGSSLRM